MPYIFYDLPADSSELETVHGYQVSRIAYRASGGPVKREPAFAPPAELILEGPRRPWFEPAMARVQPAPGMARRAPTRAWTTRGFISTRALAGYVCVPSLCFTLVWLMGHI